MRELTLGSWLDQFGKLMDLSDFRRLSNAFDSIPLTIVAGRIGIFGAVSLSSPSVMNGIDMEPVFLSTFPYTSGVLAVIENLSDPHHVRIER